MTDSRKPLGVVFGTLAWAVGIEAAILLGGMYLGRNATGAAAVQAVIAEFGCGRLKVTWSDPDRPPPDTKEIAKRALKGAGFAFGTAAVLMLVAVVAKAATLQPVRGIAGGQLAVGLLVAGLLAVRDELVLRGAILRALDGAVSRFTALAVCALVAGALSYGTTPETPLEGLSSGALGFAFASLWIVDRGAWMAWGANTAFRLSTLTLTQGALIDVRAAAGPWGGGDSGLMAGRIGVLVTIAAAVFAWFLVRRSSRSGAVE